MRLSHCHNVDDLRSWSRRKLPQRIFGFLEGGADDEWTLRHNLRSYDQYEFVPRCLRDVASVSLSTRVLGCHLDMPLILSPVAGVRLFHPDRELAVARAAHRRRVLFTLSTMATSSIEEVAQASSGPRMFQVYLHKDRGLTKELVARCRAAGFQALCLTVDMPVAGNRERDKRSSMRMPPTLDWRSLGDYLRHPAWFGRHLVHPAFRFANLETGGSGPAAVAMRADQYIDSQFDRSATWRDAAWLAGLWGGPFALKGILAVEDARRAIDVGATAVLISNHGGRQLDGVAAPIEFVQPLRQAVGDALELIVDGGIRRGAQILKALALGADCCAFGRPYLYALSVRGQLGVEWLLDLMRAELQRGLALLGCPAATELDERFLHSCSRGRADRIYGQSNA
jgi:L-lactate dehydrogenase (cytochrome)